MSLRIFSVSCFRSFTSRPVICIRTANMSSIIKNVQTTLAENFTGSAHEAAPNENKFRLEDVPDQTGKVAVITGGSEGMLIIT